MNSELKFLNQPERFVSSRRRFVGGAGLLALRVFGSRLATLGADLGCYSFRKWRLAVSLANKGRALACGALLLATAATSAPNAIQLPAELRLAPLPGCAMAMETCAIYHLADYANYRPPGMTQPQCTAEMTKLQHTYSAPISDREVKRVGASLALANGRSRVIDDSVIVASADPEPAAGLSVDPAVPSSPAGVGPAIDVQALLNANACLSCHAIAQKIVGPAYHDVAVKYKGDAQALTKLEASIRQGGVGKWGQVPMPPFAGLSDAQVKALAEFVFKQ